MAKQNKIGLGPSSILKAHNIEANGLVYPLGRGISDTHKRGTDSIKARIMRIMNGGKPAPWTPPQIRTKLLKEKIKEAHLNSLKWGKIEDSVDSLRLGAPRYRNNDFRHIAELMHLEHMIYREHRSDSIGGMGWGLGWRYLTGKYPEESLAMMDELCNDSKHHHREERKQDELQKEITGKEEDKNDRLSKSVFDKWWLEQGGK